MTPENLEEGQEYVVSIDVGKEGHDEHPQLDPGDLVTLVNGTPDADGEVYVTATATRDNAAIGAWVLPQYLWTTEQASQWVDEHQDIARMSPGFHYHDEGEDEDTSPEVIREFSYIPHPDYPNLPTYETLPLGYVMGLTQFVQNGGKPQLTPEQALLQQYLTSRGFPTG